MTRGTINNIILRHKQARELFYNRNLQDATQKDDIYYYCLLVMETTVVTILKSNQEICVDPIDVNIILAYLNVNLTPNILNNPLAPMQYF